MVGTSCETRQSRRLRCYTCGHISNRTCTGNRLHSRSTLGTSYRTTFSKMFGKSTLSQSSPECGHFLVHYGDCWSIQMLLEANNVTASALNNVRHAQMFLTRFFMLWFGTCLFHEEHLEVGTCLKVSLYPRTTTSQAFLDYGWYTLSIQQGKRTIHSSGNWLPAVGNGTTQQVIAIVDVENKQLLSTVYCGRGTEQPRRMSRRYSTTSPMPSLAVLKNLRLVNLRLWLMWCELRYETSQHENTSFSDWQVHSYGSTVRTASWRQRSETAHSQADTVAGGWFLLHPHPKLDAFLQATPELQINATLPFDIPNAPESLDVGTSTYADDIIREIPGIYAENVIARINRSNDALDNALAPDYVQNSGKQEIFFHFFGRGSHAELRIMFGDFHNLEGRVHRRVRYLGPHIPFDGRLGCETSRRVQAARNTCSLFKRFFAKTASL